MGKSSKQTVGYKYFAGLQVALGNCIEQILNINPDNRGWILSDRIYQDILKEGDVSLFLNGVCRHEPINREYVKNVLFLNGVCRHERE